MKIIKYADNTTSVGLISSDDATQHRNEVDQAVTWCVNNDLLLNTAKTKELIVDFRNMLNPKIPIQINQKQISALCS